MFNLYAFDSLRSTAITPPQLEIVNCTFKYFVNHHDALIQVETNNLGFIGEVPESADDEDYRVLAYYGQDKGAMITIEDSNFLSSSFCKGLIYYNRF